MLATHGIHTQGRLLRRRLQPITSIASISTFTTVVVVAVVVTVVAVCQLLIGSARWLVGSLARWLLE